VASNLSCIGFAADGAAPIEDLLRTVLPASEPVGRQDGVDVFRWEDASGARLVISLRDGEVLDLLPSFAGRPGVRIADCHPLNADVAGAQVVDEDGEQTTAMAFELEQRRALAGRAPVAGIASVIALGHDVSVHADEAAFAASPRSLMNRYAEAEDPPARASELGLPWPPRMAAESFISYGVWGEPEQAEAYARLNGTVLAAEQRRNSLTGADFHVCRVRTMDFEVDLLLDARDHPEPPAPGQVVAATPYLVASIESLGFGTDEAPKRRWFGRR
jgi:hypothetical protein